MISDNKWVEARHACSATAMFEKLKLEVRLDVEEKNKLREVGDGCKFDVAQHGTYFTVFGEGPVEEPSVTFALSGKKILVTSGDNQLFTATLTLNELGECRFKINNDCRESWQLRLMALEPLFFG